LGISKAYFSANLKWIHTNMRPYCSVYCMSRFLSCTACWSMCLCIFFNKQPIDQIRPDLYHIKSLVFVLLCALGLVMFGWLGCGWAIICGHVCIMTCLILRCSKELHCKLYLEWSSSRVNKLPSGSCINSLF